MTPTRLEGWLAAAFVLTSLAHLAACDAVGGKECERVRIIHVVDLPGCLKKPVPSVICQGHCASFVQVISFRNVRGATCPSFAPSYLFVCVCVVFNILKLSLLITGLGKTTMEDRKVVQMLPRGRESRVQSSFDLPPSFGQSSACEYSADANTRVKSPVTYTARFEFRRFIKVRRS